MMSKPVTSTEEGRNTSWSFVGSGQPSDENGTSAEENQVSRTSGSLFRDEVRLCLLRISSSLLPTKTFPLPSYQAGI